MNVPRRFLVEAGVMEGESVELAGAELHHAARVLRLDAGEAVEVFDGMGNARGAEVEVPEAGRIVLRLLGPAPPREPERQVDLAVALLDSDEFDLVIRDGCQLGATGFVPLVSRRVRPGLAKGAARRIDRWKKIAAESAKQCGRSRIAAIAEPCPLEEVLARTGGAGLVVVLDPSGEPFGRGDDPARPVTLVVGPEGGWSPEETLAIVASGAIRWSLGERVLRAGTAALAALARLAV